MYNEAFAIAMKRERQPEDYGLFKYFLDLDLDMYGPQNPISPPASSTYDDGLPYLLVLLCRVAENENTPLLAALMSIEDLNSRCS